LARRSWRRIVMNILNSWCGGLRRNRSNSEFTSIDMLIKVVKGHTVQCLVPCSQPNCYGMSVTLRPSHIREPSEH
jgi:hypothetical protein